MWTLCNNSDVKFVFKELNGSTCFEYCSTFINKNGTEVVVPDSMYQKFIEENTVMIFRRNNE